jgi:hypothetical protein
MGIEIKWTDTDPETGERRFLRAEKFAGEWHFSSRKQRRDVQWRKGLTPTLGMWEVVFDSLQRRYRRREGVTDQDLEQVERVLRELRQREGDIPTSDSDADPGRDRSGA